MVSINKSFLYGICFASVTWLVSLYLYWQLNRTIVASTSTDPQPSKVIERNNLVGDDFKQLRGGKLHNFKDETLEGKKAFKSYVNSKQLIKNLQPVYKNVLDEDEKALQELGMVRTREDQTIKDDGYKTHAYNVLISNQLSYDRNVPDTRNKLCKDVIYPKQLPTASVIICFYNEHYHTLLRTIHSIINRTQSEILKEIVLVDDYSDLKDLNSALQTYINASFRDKVKLYKTERREGLIRARMFGARKATGEVVVFLDSHVEVNVDWLRPMLSRIKDNRTNVVVPIIDIINPDTFAYTASPLVRGGFNWGLHFKWDSLPTGTLSKDEDFIKPIKSPTMAGGLFAMSRDYFVELGEYDAGMNIWGGENIEISFRIWMCGGRLDLIPCSRVGHIFRHRRPYGSPNGEDTMLYNSLRVAHVWLDDYKEHFLSQRPESKSMNFGDVSSRIQLRKELKCRDFDWYLKNVYPELILPSDEGEKLQKKWAALDQGNFQPWHSRKRNYTDHFQIRLADTNLCVQGDKDLKSKGSKLFLQPCLRTKTQIWYETGKNELVLAQLFCLQSAKLEPYLYKCHEMGGDQEWHHKGQNKIPIYNVAAGKCLTAKSNKLGVIVSLDICTSQSLNKWDLVR